MLSKPPVPYQDAPAGIEGARIPLGLARHPLSDNAHFVDYAAVLGMVCLIVLGGAGTLGLRMGLLYEDWTGTLVATLQRSTEMAP